MAYRQVLNKLYFFEDLNPPQNVILTVKGFYSERSLSGVFLLCLLNPIHLHMV